VNEIDLDANPPPLPRIITPRPVATGNGRRPACEGFYTGCQDGCRRCVRLGKLTLRQRLVELRPDEVEQLLSPGFMPYPRAHLEQLLLEVRGEMKYFTTFEVEEALAHAKTGGQALHCHRIIPDRARAPRCFVAAVDKGEDIAHLFDLDTERLKATARRLGVKVVFVDRGGTDSQHIDLCGLPLRRAKMEAGVTR
jgi:hypothetical protein